MRAHVKTSGDWIATRFAAWREPAWQLKPWSEMPAKYRACFAWYPILLCTAIFVWLTTGMSTSFSSSDAWWFAPAAIVILGATAVSSVRMNRTTAWHTEDVGCLALIASGHAEIAVGAAVLCAAFRIIRKPLVLHLSLANLVESASRTALASCVFVWVAAQSPTLSPMWAMAVVCALLTTQVLSMSGSIIMVVGGYLNWRESLDAVRNAVTAEFVAGLPLAIAVGAMLASGWRGYVLALVVPYLVTVDLNARTEKIVAATLRTEFFQRTFSRYVPESMVAQLDEHAVEIALGGKELELTALFCDIRGFTAWSETLPATEIISELNLLLGDLAAAVFETGGTLDKFTGDGLMAFWGAPVEQSDHADRACVTAQRMAEALHVRNTLRGEIGQPPLAVGIGIHTGKAVVGNVGHQDRHDYTAIGDTINTAARLEAATKQVGCMAIVSEKTFASLSPERQALCGQHQSITLPGKRDPVEIRVLLDGEGPALRLVA